MADTAAGYFDNVTSRWQHDAKPALTVSRQRRDCLPAVFHAETGISKWRRARHPFSGRTGVNWTDFDQAFDAANAWG